MTYSSFEINVSLNGRHYFATSERSIRDSKQCIEIKTELERRFPESEGFKVSVSGQVSYGHGNLSTADLIEYNAKGCI